MTLCLTTACSLCSAPLTGGKDTFGAHDWPLCWDCRWWEIDLKVEHYSPEALPAHVHRGNAESINNNFCDTFDAPAQFQCPECWSPLRVEIFEWESDTGKPTESGLHIKCVAEEDAMNAMIAAVTKDGYNARLSYEKIQHRGYQSDWAYVESGVTEWAIKNLTVYCTPPTTITLPEGATKP